jgi:tRNA pseudouridine38-40 synthase
MPAWHRDVRLKLTIAYDGSAFKGWQSQPFRLTVQDVLEDAFRRIIGSRVIVHGAGRTDTGVHAVGQVAHVEVTERFSPAEWRRILNFNLPPTLRIMKCEPVKQAFHASLSASGKVYQYRILNQDVLPPHEVGRVWMVPEKLNLTHLRKAAALFVGTHDFGGFAMNRRSPNHTVRTITSLTVSKKSSLITLTFEGKGFLYRMVRMLTGSMVRVARGQDSLEDLSARLQTPKNPKWEHVAPASGLHLVRVMY